MSSSDGVFCCWKEEGAKLLRSRVPRPVTRDTRNASALLSALQVGKVQALISRVDGMGHGGEASQTGPVSSSTTRVSARRDRISVAL